MSAQNKGAQFLGQRIGQDALTIAELIAQGEAKDARIAELEAVLTPKQRERLEGVQAVAHEQSPPTGAR
ncbi:MAG: hypothetical protein K2X72_04250 [Reyranella sp.]|nr:hypothetical protein [Reyranella sp.]